MLYNFFGKKPKELRKLKEMKKDNTVKTLLETLLQDRKYESVPDESSKVGEMYLDFYKRLLEYPTTQQESFSNSTRIIQNFVQSPYLRLF